MAKNESLSGLRLGFHPTCPNRSVIAMINACTDFATKELRNRRMAKLASVESKRIKKKIQAEWKREKAEMRSRSALQRARKRIEKSCRSTDRGTFDEEQYERDLDNHHAAIIKAVNKKALSMVRKSAQSPRKKKRGKSKSPSKYKSSKASRKSASRRQSQSSARGSRRKSPSLSSARRGRSNSSEQKATARSRSPPGKDGPLPRFQSRSRSRSPRQQSKSRAEGTKAEQRHGQTIEEIQDSKEQKTPSRERGGDDDDERAELEVGNESAQSPASPLAFEMGGSSGRYDFASFAH